MGTGVANELGHQYDRNLSKHIGEIGFLSELKKGGLGGPKWLIFGKILNQLKMTGLF